MKKFATVIIAIYTLFFCNCVNAKPKFDNYCIYQITPEQNILINDTKKYYVVSYDTLPIIVFRGCALIRLDISYTGNVRSAQVLKSSGSPVDDWLKAVAGLRFTKRDVNWYGLLFVWAGPEGEEEY